MNLNVKGLGDLGGVLPVAFLLWWVLLVIVHVSFAVAVFTDASQPRQQGQLRFVGPLVWSLATLITGVVGVLAYWLIHHSALVRPLQQSSSDPQFPHV